MEHHSCHVIIMALVPEFLPELKAKKEKANDHIKRPNAFQ